MPHPTLPGSHTGGVNDAPRAVIFDFGNTLFANSDLSQTIADAFRNLGADVDPDIVGPLGMRIYDAAHTPEEWALGRDLDASVWAERWLVHYAIADEVIAGAGAEIYRLMHAPERWIPFATTADTLRRLHEAGVPVGVLSNTGWDIRTVFRHHELDQFIDAFALSYEIGCAKANPPAFWRACDLLGVTPTQALMVGDDTTADAGAANAGLRTLLLPLQEQGRDNGVGMVLRLFE